MFMSTSRNNAGRTDGTAESALILEKRGVKTMLTQRDEQGNWSLKGVSWNELHPGSILDDKTWGRLYGAVWKLMEYEDTGLDPEQVRELAERNRAVRSGLRWMCMIRAAPVSAKRRLTAGWYIRAGMSRSLPGIKDCLST